MPSGGPAGTVSAGISITGPAMANAAGAPVRNAVGIAQGPLSIPIEQTGYWNSSPRIGASFLGRPRSAYRVISASSFSSMKSNSR